MANKTTAPSNVKVPAWVDGLKSAHAEITKAGATADNLATTNKDRQQMRRAISCENDANVIKRVIDRAGEGFYSPAAV